MIDQYAPATRLIKGSSTLRYLMAALAVFCLPSSSFVCIQKHARTPNPFEPPSLNVYTYIYMYNQCSGLDEKIAEIATFPKSA